MFDLYPKLIGFIQNRITPVIRNHYFPRWVIFSMDTLLVLCLFLIAYILRFNFAFNAFNHLVAFEHGLITLAIYIFYFAIFRLHARLLRHTTVIDIFYLLVATSLSAATLSLISIIGSILGWSQPFVVPLSVLIIHYLLISVFLFSVRIAIKLFFLLITTTGETKKRVLIYGAGAAGVIVKRVIQSDVKSAYQIAGFVDENKKLQGKQLNGFKVFSPAILSENYLRRNKIQTLIFAIKEISSEEKSRIVRSALDLGLEVLDTPPVESWLDGQLQISQIHKVELEDLLGREPIQLDMQKIEKGLHNKTILVTGAAGSIGSEIVRQLTRFNTKKLILVDQAETPMFHLENELKANFGYCAVKIILADITHPDKMELIFQEHHPDVVFHAAAYKHVPLMEENPHEAIRVNVGGTKNITRLSVQYGVKKFVMISSDKAVNPTNVMGASKRICEMIVQMKAQQAGNKTQFVITRFGNVLGSNGSVIPIFTKQIEAGGPITVTHPEVTRYFMTIPEACQLVLEAGFMGKGNEIFVFDMGKPVRIADLANQMIRLSGLVPEKDIKVIYTGLRPGEKLYEELLTDNENTMPTYHPKIKIAQVEVFNYEKIFSKINILLKNLYGLSKQEAVDFFKELVPEFKSNNSTYIKQSGKTKQIEIEKTVETSLINNPVKALKSIVKSKIPQ
jgi:FlaA1/EpsC-like NDP-sugar epimerase